MAKLVLSSDQDGEEIESGDSKDVRDAKNDSSLVEMVAARKKFHGYDKRELMQVSTKMMSEVH